jgi:hypothetical protein
LFTALSRWLVFILSFTRKKRIENGLILLDSINGEYHNQSSRHFGRRHRRPHSELRPKLKLVPTKRGKDQKARNPPTLDAARFMNQNPTQVGELV